MTNLAVKTESITHYMSEIHRYPLLSKKDELELANRYRSTGDLEAAHRLVVCNLRFVLKIAHEYHGYGLKLLDLVQEGNIGLMMAVKKFEPSKGYRLISYAVWWIRAYMQNFIMRSWSLVKLGTTQAQRKLFFKLRSEREAADREAQGQHEVDAAELAARLKVNQEEVISMSARLGSRDFSLDAPVKQQATQSYMDTLAASSNQEEDFALLEKRMHVRDQVGEAMKALNEKERYIVEHRLMCDEPKTLQEIGHHFNISRERARQIEGNVIRKIKTLFLKKGLGPLALCH